MRQLAQEVLTKHNVRVKIDDKVLQFLIDDKGDTESDAGGARAAIGKLTEEVTTEVAAFINAHPGERTIRVDVIGALVSDNKDMLKTDAHIEVTAVR